MLNRLSGHWRLLLGGLVLTLALGATGYIAGREWGPSWASADDPAGLTDKGAGPSITEVAPPGPSVTPKPGETPDTTKPFWYVPFGNQDRMAPKQTDPVNGIRFGVKDGPLPLCTKTTIPKDWHAAVAGTSFDLKIGSLPAGATLRGTPRVGQCADDGRIMWIIADFNVAPATGVNDGGGALTISRWEAVRWYSQEFSASLVSAAQVHGRPAVFVEVPITAKIIGQAAVVVVDDEIQGSTMLLGSDVSLAVIKNVAEALYR